MTTGSRQSFWTSGKASAKSYVRDGLITMWDGIENSGFKSHSPSVAVWRNLGSLGSSFNATSPSAIEFTDNGAVFNATKCFSTPANFMSGQMKGEWTVEAVFTLYSGSFANYHGVCGEHSEATATNGLLCCQYQNSYFYSGIYRQGSQSGNKAMCIIPASAFQASRIYTVSMAVSATQLKFNVYVDGTDATSKGATYTKLPSASSDLTLTSTYPFNIGSAFTSNATDRIFIGVVHCCRVYSRMLQASEITLNNEIDNVRFMLSTD